MTTARCCSLILIAGLLASPLAAQKPAPRAGILGGVNIATLTGDDAGDASNRTGFLAGVFGEFSLSQKLAIVPELLYSQKGATQSVESVDIDFKADYLEVPLLLKLRFGAEDATVRPHIYLGPAVAFNLSCKVGGEQSGLAVELDCDDEAFEGSAAIKSTDFGGMIGVGLDLRNFLVGARYTMGFTQIPDSSTESDVKNSVFAFYLGYAFRLK